MTFSDLLQLASERLGVEIEDAGGATLALDPAGGGLGLQKYT